MSREDSPGARGRAFGLAHREAIRNTVAVYWRMLGSDRFGELGARVGDRVSAIWPGLGEEISGMAAACGLAAEDLWAVNARTELIGGAGECSLIGRVSGSRVTLAQNWDWHPDLAASRVVWTVEADGTWFTTVTEAGMLAKLGLNGRGLACGLNFLSSSLDGGVEGLPIHVLLRLVLQECGSLTEAMQLLLGAQVAASSCISLAASEGEYAALVGIELSPGGRAVVWPDDDGVLVHTNHFLGEIPEGIDLEPAERPSTLLRWWRLRTLVREGVPDVEALSCHFPSPQPVCRHPSAGGDWAHRRETLLSAVIDPSQPLLKISDGPPCSNRHAEIPLSN